MRVPSLDEPLRRLLELGDPAAKLLVVDAHARHDARGACGEIS